MITREAILNWCLTVIDVFVIIILSVAYYCKYLAAFATIFEVTESKIYSINIKVAQ